MTDAERAGQGNGAEGTNGTNAADGTHGAPLFQRSHTSRRSHRTDLWHSSHPSHFSPRHRSLLLAIGLALLAAIIACAPNLYGYLVRPRGHVFLWSADPGDNHVHLNGARTGYRGEWLFTNLFTSEDDPPVLLFPADVLLGHAAGLLRDYLTWRTGREPPVYVTLPATFEAARFAFTFALALAIYWLAGMIAPQPATRLWAVALALFAGGWRPGAINTEAHVLQSCIRFPHFILSLILYVWACGAFLRAIQRPAQWRRCAAWAAVAGFGLGWVHPFDAPPLCAIGGVALIWRWSQTRRLPWALFGAVASFALCAGGPILFQLGIKWRVASYAAIDDLNYMLWGHWWTAPWMLGSYLALAALGVAFLWRRRRKPAAMFVIVWVVVGFAMLYAPVRFQRRMVEGLPIGLAFAVVAAVEGWVIGPLARRRRASGGGRMRLSQLRRAALFAVFLLLLPRTLWIVYEESYGAFNSAARFYYVPPDEWAAYKWLARNTDWRAVVWAPEWQGNRIPFLSGNRVFYGHNYGTAWAADKLGWTRALFSGLLPVTQFRDLALRYRVEYVLWPARNAVRGVTADSADYAPEILGMPVYSNALMRVYKLRR